jgi:hypothetical protein
MTKAIRIIIRVIAFPFFSAIGLLYSIVLWIRYSLNFLWYGGEAVAYTKRINSVTITDLVYKLDETLNSEQEAAVCDARKDDSSTSDDNIIN